MKHAWKAITVKTVENKQRPKKQTKVSKTNTGLQKQTQIYKNKERSQKTNKDLKNIERSQKTKVSKKSNKGFKNKRRS